MSEAKAKKHSKKSAEQELEPPIEEKGDLTGGESLIESDDAGATTSPGGDTSANAEPESSEVAEAGAAVEEDVNEKVTRLEASLLRAKADYQNLQRNAAREKSDAIRFANAGLIRSLLVVMDDMERSLKAAAEDDDPSGVHDGIRLVYENFGKALKDHGMTAIQAEGQRFDPQIHEAMMQQPSADHPEGTVISEIARGYMLFDRVIRPSKVIVAKSVEKADSEE
ncbi:MAG: nucleotide exchange factor GrpE [Planctomycetota bacterium]|jgi:molecular chaperone GrpE